MASPNKPINCPFLVKSCEECPLANIKSRKCAWQAIKKYYSEEREQKAREGYLDPNQFHVSRTVIFSNAPIIKVYTVPFLKDMISRAKCTCGQQFSPQDLQSYPHPDGIIIEGLTLRQWAYAHCKKCGNDMALWKIFQQLGRSL